MMVSEPQFRIFQENQPQKGLQVVQVKKLGEIRLGTMSRSLWRISKTRAIILVTSSEVHTKGQCIKDSRILSRADYIAKRQIDVKVTQTMLAVLFRGTLLSTCCLENQVINQWILSFPSSARSANCPPLTNVMDRPVHQNRRHLWRCRAPVCPAPDSWHCEVTLFLKACGISICTSSHIICFLLFGLEFGGACVYVVCSKGKLSFCLL